ncbi:MAG: hypothetical protein ACK4LT_07200 [Aquificaceae bacterium]
MKLNYKKEDYILGFFMLFGVFYPFFTALLIFLEDVKAKRQEVEEIESFYSFLLGLEECKEEKAEELSSLMSEDLYKLMRGKEGLVNTCQSYRKAYPSARAEGKMVKDGEFLVELVKKEKGMTQRLASVKIYFEKEGENIKITKVEYEKGS